MKLVFLRDSDVHLWNGNVDTRACKSFLDGLVRREKDVPIVGIRGPTTNGERDRASVKSRDFRNRSRGVQHLRNGRKRGDGGLACKSNVRTIGNGAVDIDASRIERRVVCNGRAPGRFIGDCDATVIRSRKRNSHHVEGCDGAFKPSNGHVVADLEWFIDSNHEAARQAAKGFLKGEAQDEAGNTETCDKRANIDAELAEDDDRKKRPGRFDEDGDDEARGERVATIGTNQHLREDLVENANEDDADEQNDDRGKDIHRVGNACCGEPTHDLVGDIDCLFFHDCIFYLRLDEVERRARQKCRAPLGLHQRVLGDEDDGEDVHDPVDTLEVERECVDERIGDHAGHDAV